MTTSQGPGRSGSADPGEAARPDEERSDEEQLGEKLRGAQERRERARRKRHIDEVFGTVLPNTTNDERAPGERGGFSAEHYRTNRPPHHGG